MNRNTECEQKREVGAMPILSSVARAAPQRPTAAPPRLRRPRARVTPPSMAAVTSVAGEAMPRPLQYRLEILEALTDDEADTFVATGFAEDSSFEMNAAGLWDQTRLEGDVLDDGDEE